MTNKAVISELSWRSLEMQKAHFPNMPHFIAPDDLPNLLRPTRRNTGTLIHVVSLAVIADNEKDFREFLSSMAIRGCGLKSIEEDIGIYDGKFPSKKIVELWRKARRNGAAKAGGDARSENAERKFWIGFAKIQDRWHLPSDGNKSEELLEEAYTTRNTVVAHLGYTRLEWRKLSATQRERILKRKANAKR